MIVGSILENREFEKRIAVTPDIVKKYKSIGLNVCLPKGYGLHLDIDDQEFLKEGAEILNNDNEVIAKSNLIVQLNLLDDDVLKKFSSLSAAVNRNFSKAIAESVTLNIGSILAKI